MGQYSGLDDITERNILSAYVSTPYAGVFAVRDLLSQQVFAALVSRFSRNPEPFQKRLIQGIVEGDIPMPPQGEIGLASVMHHSLGSSANTIKRYAQGMGHHAMKELVNVRMVLESVPTTTLMRIVNHPRLHPLSGSTRYLNFTQPSPETLWNPDIVHSPFAGKLFDAIKATARASEELGQVLETELRGFEPNKDWAEHLRKSKGDKAVEELVNNAIEATVMDSLRYLCPAPVALSIGFSADARTLEEIITGLISSPVLSDQITGERIWAELKRLYPVIFGEGANIKRDKFSVELAHRITEMLPALFEFEREGLYETNVPRIRKLPINRLDDVLIAAVLCWEQGRGSLMQYYEELAQHPEKVKSVISAVKALRGKGDELPSAFNVSLPVYESLMDFGANRDMRRHRRWAMLNQHLTASLGYEEPPLIAAVPKASAILQEAAAARASLYNELEQYYREKGDLDWLARAEIVPLFAHRVRSLMFGTIGQLSYVAELRSGVHGHDSYREIAHMLFESLAQDFPLASETMQIDRRAYSPLLLKSARRFYEGSHGDN